MNSKIQHNYVMKEELNFEYEIFKEFLRRLNFTNQDFDCVVLIDGEEKEETNVWLGLS